MASALYFMNKTCFSLLFIFTFFSFTCIHAEMDMEEELSSSQELLFVSLGSVCEPAHMLRYSELRRTAFPFDWIISFDGEALIEMLENNFVGFLDDQYFVPFGPAGHLLQTHYHLEFLHEGDFNSGFYDKLAVLKEKYQRRIQRFANLKDYPGKIVFIRYAYPHSTTDPHRFYKFEENLEITEDYTVRLYVALRNFFPNLDFTLVVLNHGFQDGFEEQEKIGEHIKVFRVPPVYDLQMKIECYKMFFERLSFETLSM